METFETWQTEIAAELEQAKLTMQASTEALAAAEVARDLARAEQLKIHAMLNMLQQPAPTSLMNRAHPIEAAYREAVGAVTLAKGKVVNVSRQVDDLQAALDGLTKLLTPVEGEEVSA
jgi:hypothetical protein